MLMLTVESRLTLRQVRRSMMRYSSRPRKFVLVDLFIYSTRVVKRTIFDQCDANFAELYIIILYLQVLFSH